MFDQFFTRSYYAREKPVWAYGRICTTTGAKPEVCPELSENHRLRPDNRIAVRAGVLPRAQL